jgi:hypothetical protein
MKRSPSAGPAGGVRNPERPSEVSEEDGPPAPPGRQALRMDPRLARRWAEVRRQQGRRRLKILLLIAIPAALVALAAGALYSPLLEVRQVRVSVRGAIPPSQLAVLSGAVPRGPMIDVNTARIAAQIDAVPNLGGARVVRSWPTTVFVHVVARSPVAVVARAGVHPGQAGWSTVDATGRVLANVASPGGGLPRLQGTGPVPAVGGWLEGSAGAGIDPPAQGRPLVNLNATPDSAAVPGGTSAALAIAAALPGSWRSHVWAIAVAAGGSLTMAVVPANPPTGSITVVLGDASQLAAKLTALVTLLTQANLSGVTEINLTVPNRPATLTARQTPGTLSTQPGG